MNCPETEFGSWLNLLFVSHWETINLTDIQLKKEKTHYDKLSLRYTSFQNVKGDNIYGIVLSIRDLSS